MIVLDTSILVASLAGDRPSAPRLRSALERSERMLVPSLVLYEWQRGPRIPEELIAQEALFPSSSAVPFGSDEAALAAELYRRVTRPRGREIDLAIAACALTLDAALWTLNPRDFSDIPGVRLAEGAGLEPDRRPSR